ncbi:MAG: Asp-tRNA(Asn)/Glu-tRNA(Gln) amidotransferase GatCAB subunit A [Acidiferrobacteraceae bacterium]|nr:Asp-tRNA(Asn)/Glu-tRNA(Gln) amidotransferase GatCAB subunit A [Acidiferrobacteraceae bacterium]
MTSSLIKKMSRAIRDQTVSTQELILETLESAKKLNRDLRAFELIDEAGALETASILDRELATGIDRGPLHGIPVAVKDIIDVAGWPTRCGSQAYKTTPATRDAKVITNLKSAGAVLIGKTVPHELACGVYSQPTRNPWNPDYVPGGSSGGSAAAVAAGIVPMAVGSDTGGSIRIPASVCGIAGIKPTFNRVSCSGVEPLSWSLDHIGPIATSVEDCAISLNSMLEENSSSTHHFDYSNNNLSGAIQDIRIGILRGEPVDPMLPEIETAFMDAVKQLRSRGAKIAEVTIPELRHTIAAEFAIIGPEAGYYHKQRLIDHPEKIDPDIRALLVSGLLLPTSQYIRGLQARTIIANSIQRCFNDNHLDILLTPTLPATAARVKQTEFEYEDRTEAVTISYVRTTAPFNLAGLPALSVPCGFDKNNIPIGIQFVGKPMGEAVILRVGYVYESITSWRDQKPMIAKPDSFGISQLLM